MNAIYRKTYRIRRAAGKYGIEIALPPELEMQEEKEIGMAPIKGVSSIKVECPGMGKLHRAR